MKDSYTHLLTIKILLMSTLLLYAKSSGTMRAIRSQRISKTSTKTTCIPVSDPYPSVNNNLCVYFLSAKTDPLHNYIMESKKNYTLHGWWPKTIERPQNTTVSMKTFCEQFPSNIHLLDTFNFSRICGCGYYREFLKHGLKSGYVLAEYMKRIIYCLGQMPQFHYAYQLDFDNNWVPTVGTNIPLYKQRVGWHLGHIM